MGGYFLGGVASGMNDAEKLGIADRQQKLLEQQDQNKTAEQHIAQTLKIAQDTVTAAADKGVPPAKIAGVIQPLIESAAALGGRIGGDAYSSRIRQMGSVMLSRPPAEDSKKYTVVQTGEVPDPVTGVPTKRYSKLETGSGDLTPIDHGTPSPGTQSAGLSPPGQPSLSQSEVITPRQVAVANPPAPIAPPAAPSTPAGVVADRFASLDPGTATDAGPAAPAPPAAAPAPIQVAQAGAAPATPPGQLTKQSIDLAAEQVLAGNKDAIAGLGLGKAAIATRNMIRNRVAELAAERGMSAEDINANAADFMGLKRGASALGQREGGITGAIMGAVKTIPRVVEASAAIERTRYPDINKIILMGKEKTGDENVVRLGIAVNTLVNNYARAIGAGSAQLTDTARKEAIDNLQVAWSHGQLKAATDQMMLELRSELEGAHQARREFVKGTIVKGSSTKATPSNDPLGLR